MPSPEQEVQDSDSQRVIVRRECPEHGPRNTVSHRCRAWKSPYVFCDMKLVDVEYVPREVAERLAEALEDVKRALLGQVCEQFEICQHEACMANYAAHEIAARGVDEFRAVFPKAEGVREGVNDA